MENYFELFPILLFNLWMQIFKSIKIFQSINFSAIN